MFITRESGRRYDAYLFSESKPLDNRRNTRGERERYLEKLHIHNKSLLINNI
jgi:hypothetical protein